MFSCDDGAYKVVNGKILMNFYWRGKKHSCYVQNFGARCGWSCRCIYSAQSGRENRDDKDRRNQAMSEKMLVTQALDERDLLVKKIGDKISKMKLVDVKKKK